MVLGMGLLHAPQAGAMLATSARPGTGVAPAAQGQSIVVYVHASTGYADAEDFSRRLRGDFNGGVSASLFFPERVAPTFNPRPITADLPDAGHHPLQQMAHYLTLEYPIVASLPDIAAALRKDDRFGFVDIVAGGWSAAAVNDPYFNRPAGVPDPNFVGYQWGHDQMGFGQVWDWLPGHANIGMVDAGLLPLHEDLLLALKPHLSWDYVQNDRDVTPNSAFRGHGSHVAGILAADTNNKSFFGDWVGIAGGCWNCPLLVAKAFQDDRADAVQWLADSGAQVINFSGFFSGGGSQDLPLGVPCANFSPPQQHFLCPVLSILSLRDVLIVASSGNDLRRIDFPALEPNVVAVGGMEVNGDFWNLSDDGGCPSVVLPGHGSSPQCGSNFGSEQELVAPALNVLSTFYPNATWSLPELNCLDDNFHGEFYPGLDGSGYAFCTGTSMSSAFVSAVAALVRTANPLLPATQLRSAMIAGASGGGNHTQTLGFGLPDVPLVLSRVMGMVFEAPVRNRLTPMFTLFSASANGWIYTSKPQVASAAISGLLYESPLAGFGVPFNQSPIGNPVASYTSYPLEFGPGPDPRSSFSVYAGPLNPFTGSADLIPLYRLSFIEACASRDHVYTTSQAGIDYFTETDFCPGQSGSQSYNLDGVEGWVFSQCPFGFACNNPLDDAQPQCIHRRASVSADGWALILERELSDPLYASYTITVGNSCIGYVFPNGDSDSDGLSDGFELSAGINHQANDSDCDGVDDGDEFPMTALPVSDPMMSDACADGAVLVLGQSSAQIGQPLNLSVLVSNDIGPSIGTFHVAVDVGAISDNGVNSISTTEGSCGPHPSRVDGLYLCEINTLPRGFSTTISVNVTPNFTGNRRVSAELDFFEQPDPNPGNDRHLKSIAISP